MKIPGGFVIRGRALAYLFGCGAVALSAEDAAHIKKVMVTFVELGDEKRSEWNVPLTEANLTREVLSTKCT